MEQNLKKPSTGHCGDHVRSGAGAAGQDHCLILVVEEGHASSIDWRPALERSRAGRWQLRAYYVRTQDLSHYGRVDHLAPAGDCQAFETYVKEQDAAQAEACFAPLRAALEGTACPVEVLYGKAVLQARLAQARAAGADVLML